MSKKLTDAKRRAIRKYDAKSTKQVHLKLNKVTDSKMISWLENKENVQGYIKDLVENDRKESLRKYKIRDEFVDLWGGDPDAVIDEDELEMIARGWETTPEELMEQLEEIK